MLLTAVNKCKELVMDLVKEHFYLSSQTHLVNINVWSGMTLLIQIERIPQVQRKIVGKVNRVCSIQIELCSEYHSVLKFTNHTKN